MIPPHGDAPRPVLLLDVGGVLLLPAASEVVEALEAWGASLPEVDDATLHYEAVSAFDCSGDILDYRRAYGRGLGLRGAALQSAASAHELWRRPWSIAIPSAVEKLRWLVQDGGVDVAIVSDSDGTVASQLVDTKVCQVGRGPLPAVLAVCDSTLVGARKPSRLIFDAARRAVGESRRILGHVGDSLRCDVRGAYGADLKPIHIDPLGSCPERDHRHATALADLSSGLA